jgi:calcineurin-like phosphoesterase family protein
MKRNCDSDLPRELIEVFANTGIKKIDARESVIHLDKHTELEKWSKEPNANLNETYFISDLHLDHANIIRYNNRPLDSIREMNSTIVKNWNSTVKKHDLVFFLGDMAFGRGSRTIDYWARKLKGNKIFIKGSHDKSKTIKFHDKIVLRVCGLKFLLLHDPVQKPHDWNDWVIHGHLHNRDPKYSLVNKENRTINVSAEMIGYKPISLERLLKLCC